MVQKKSKIKTEKKNNIRTLWSDYLVTFNDRSMFFKINSNTKDKLQSIAHSQKMSKFNDLCKIYLSSLQLSQSKKRKSIQQISDERLIYNRIPKKKHLVTNISLQKSHHIDSRNITNGNVNANTDANISININSNVNDLNMTPDLKMKSSHMITTHLSDKYIREENGLTFYNGSVGHSEYDMNMSSSLRRTNESKDKRCSSASTSYCLKTKLKTSKVLHLVPTKEYQNQLKINNAPKSNTQTNKLKLTKKKTMIEVHDKKEVNDTLNGNILIDNDDRNRNGNYDKKSHIQLEESKHATDEGDDDKLANCLNTISTHNKQTEKPSCIDKNNNNDPDSIIINNNNTKDNENNNDDGNGVNGQLINANIINNSIQKLHKENQFKPNRRTFKKSKTIETKDIVRQRRNGDTFLQRSKDYLQILLKEAEMNQIEKRKKEMLTEFPIVLQTVNEDEDNNQESKEQEKETILNNIHLDTEDDCFGSNNDQQPKKISKTTKSERQDKQIDIFSFKMLKNDTQDTVPTSRISDAEKHDFVNENNLSDYNSSVHSLSIASIIAKNKKPSIYLKNYMTQLSKISEFSHQEPFKNPKESSSDHRSFKSNGIGELEPISPINSPKIFKKSTTVNFNALSYARTQKKYKTTISEAIQSDNYYSSQSDDYGKVFDIKQGRKSYCSIREKKSCCSEMERKKNRNLSFIAPTEVNFGQSSLIANLEKDITYTLKDVSTKTKSSKQNLIVRSFTSTEAKLDTFLSHEVMMNKAIEIEKPNVYQIYISSIPLQAQTPSSIDDATISKDNDDIIEQSYLLKSHLETPLINLSINRSYCIDHLQYYYFDINLVKKLIIEQYFSKDFEMIYLPTLFFNFTDSQHKNISFKQRKMNVIQRNVPFLIKLTAGCMSYYNIFLFYDNPENKNLPYNLSKKDSLLTKVNRPSISESCTIKSLFRSKQNVNNLFIVRNQSKKNTLTKTNNQKPLKSQITKRFRNSITTKLSINQTPKPKPRDSILKSSFYKRNHENMSYE